MNDDSVAQGSNEASLEINLPELVNLCSGVLNQVILAGEKDRSKQLYKDIKKGNTPSVGKIEIGGKSTLNLKLSLDYSEFVGPGFNFEVFQASLRPLLNQISVRLKAKKELNIRTSEQGDILIDEIGAVQIGEQVNVLMMALKLNTPGMAFIKMMYMEPEQFRKPDSPTTS